MNYIVKMELCDNVQIVKAELESLLINHSLREAISAVDEIVLNYVLGILEGLSSHGDMEDSEEVEQFAEMMEAYLPGFALISIFEVREWMFKISDKLSAEQHQDERKELTQSTISYQEYVGQSISNRETDSSKSSEGDASCQKAKLKDSHETKVSLVTEKDCCEEQSDVIVMLQELCPEACSAEIHHCFQVSGCDLEEAARLLLYRQETGTAITPVAAVQTRKRTSSNSTPLDDELVKDNILARYSFVATDEDKKTHKPTLLAKDEKKLVRYRDGQIVSTKGERFSEIKRQDSDEVKKTYVSLNPARKYRFH